jgi:catechol 2,3-dioxygenase-like lactoylglutathione lyase family enzyme
MSVPKLVALRHVKVPVTDLPVALEWYGRVLGFRAMLEFPDPDGVVRGVHGELPGIGDVLALREDPDAARGLGVFANPDGQEIHLYAPIRS